MNAAVKRRVFLVLIEIPGTYERRELKFASFREARNYASHVPTVLKVAAIVGAWREARKEIRKPHSHIV